MALGWQAEFNGPDGARVYDWPCLASVKSGRGSLAVLRLHANGGITSRMQRMRRHSMIACSADFSIVDAKSTSVTAERRARATNQMCDDDMVAVVRGPRVLRCGYASVCGRRVGRGSEGSVVEAVLGPWRAPAHVRALNQSAILGGPRSTSASTESCAFVPQIFKALEPQTRPRGKMFWVT